MKKGISMVDFMQKVPGGLLLTPLIIACAINSTFPGVLRIGGPATGIFTSVNAFLGAYFLSVGANLSLKAAPKAIKVGAVVTLTKLLVSIAVGLLVRNFFNNSFAGLSAVAIIAGMSNSNGAMYTLLCRMYGDEADLGSIAIVSLNDGPFFTMIALGTTGLADIPLQTLVAVIIPLALGVLFGNLDPRMKKMLNDGESLILMLLSFSVGSTMHFSQLIEGGIPGIVLALMTLLVGSVFTVTADRLTGGTGIAGAAISTVAGNAIATPLAVAEADPSIRPAAVAATPQIAAAMIVSAFICPFLTTYVNKHFRRKDPVPTNV